MTFFESIMVAVFCMAIVFAVLVSLFVLVKLLSLCINIINIKSAGSNGPSGRETKKSDNIGREREPVISRNLLKLNKVDEPTAALIMAIVSDESRIPLSELNFKSIRKLN